MEALSSSTAATQLVTTFILPFSLLQVTHRWDCICIFQVNFFLWITKRDSSSIRFVFWINVFNNLNDLSWRTIKETYKYIKMSCRSRSNFCNSAYSLPSFAAIFIIKNESILNCNYHEIKFHQHLCLKNYAINYNIPYI
jgi:hypothetical protein